MYFAAMVESVDTLDSKSGELRLVPVQVRLAVPTQANQADNIIIVTLNVTIIMLTPMRCRI